MNFSMSALVECHPQRSRGGARECLYRRQRRQQRRVYLYRSQAAGQQLQRGRKDCDVRQTSAMDVINRLRPKLNRLPVASAFLQPGQDLRIGGRGSNALYQYTIQSRQLSRPGALGTDSAGAHEEAARPAGCEYRPAKRRPGRYAHLRPDRRGTSRPNSPVARQFALQRLRPI